MHKLYENCPKSSQENTPNVNQTQLYPSSYTRQNRSNFKMVSRAVAEAVAADIIEKMGWEISKVRCGDVKRVVDTLLQDLEPTDPTRQFLSHRGVVAMISLQFEREARGGVPKFEFGLGPLTILDLVVFILMQIGVVLNAAQGIVSSKRLPFEFTSEDLVTIASAIFVARGSLIADECPFATAAGWLTRASESLEHTSWMRRLSPYARRGWVFVLFDCIARDPTEPTEGKWAKSRQTIQNRENELDAYLDEMAFNAIVSRVLLPRLEALEAQLASDRAPKRVREGESDTDEGSHGDGVEL